MTDQITPPVALAAHRADQAHPQGLRVGPGGPLVPRLRRLLDPRPDPEGDARLRRAQGEHRVHLGHRLRRPAPVLHEHLRVPHDPRPRADDRDRAQGVAPRPHGLGHHRRRRRAVHRRQPPPALDAPERGHHDGHAQQPDLRPDQGPGVAHVGARQEDEVDADGLRRPADPAADDRAGRRGHVRGADGGHPHRAHPDDARGAPAATAAARSSRSSRTATSSTTGPGATSRTARSARTGCSPWSTASR